MSPKSLAAALLVGLAAAVGSAGGAAALSIDVEVRQDGSDVLNVFGAPGERWYRTVGTNLGGTGRTVHAGLFRLTDGGTLLGEFDAFCVELTSTLKLPQSYTVGADVFSAPVIDRIDLLWTNAFREVADSDTAAAFQLALWNIVHDTDSDVKTGTFRVTNNLASGFVALANQWLGKLDGEWTERSGAFTVLGREGAGQNLIAPVPLPAAVWMLGAGVLGLFGLRRRTA